MLIRNTTVVPLASQGTATGLRRPSRSLSVYQQAQAEVTPVTGVRGNAVPDTGLNDGRNFSAQLLELGLRHKVEGLVNRAADHLAAAASANATTPYDRYEAAQQNFADPHLVRWYI